ncbi:MAG: hypothetical protein CBD11_02440 [Phycisphaera sp. TMED151]|nr:MAG: hypothetical protein CBD11_02440 [Phycisphaera sp. TMED151]
MIILTGHPRMLFGLPKRRSWSPVNGWILWSSKLILEPFTGLQVSPNHLLVWTLRARITRTSRFAFWQSIVHD